MNLSDYLTIVAILFAPIIAIVVGKYLDDRKEKKEAKLWIFRSLMATRAVPMSQEHVRALNMIDVNFYGEDTKSKKVVEAWNLLRDNFYKNVDTTSTALLTQWGDKNQELLMELLQKMAEYLNFSFDKTAIKNTSYFPKGYGETEDELMFIRKGFVEMIKGNSTLPIEVRFKEPDEDGKKLHENLKKYFANETPIRVIITNED